MIDQLKAVLSWVHPFEESELALIMPYFKPRTLRAHEPLLRHGAVCDHFYFVAEGCIRVYFTDGRGEEKTRYIMPKNHIGTALASFIKQAPSFEQVDALADSQLLAIRHSDFYALVERVQNWRLFYQKILEMAYSFQTQKIESLVTKTAKERFEQAMKETPHLFHTVSNKVLASYLDMRPETLSRLKSH